jgi:hypothetical protein
LSYDFLPNCVISFFLYLILHTYIQIFDVTGNLEKKLPKHGLSYHYDTKVQNRDKVELLAPDFLDENHFTVAER